MFNYIEFSNQSFFFNAHLNHIAKEVKYIVRQNIVLTIMTITMMKPLQKEMHQTKWVSLIPNSKALMCTITMITLIPFWNVYICTLFHVSKIIFKQQIILNFKYATT